MKNKIIIIPIIILFLLLPFMVNAKTCDTKSISISSISMVEKSKHVVEEAKIEGKNIKLNLSMSKLGDNIKYKVVVKNESNDDYLLDLDSLKDNSKYIEYTVSTEDNSHLIAAKSSKTINLKVEYKKIIPEEDFSSGIYNDNKIIAVPISTKDKLINPKTGYSLLLIIIILIIMSTIVLLKTKHSKSMILIIGLITIIPISCYAICKTDLKIDSSVEIKNKSFTGTLYRYNNVYVRNGTDISGYLLKGTDGNYIFNSEEECNAVADQNVVCEEIQDSIFNYPGFSRDKESLDKHVYLRHDVVNNIIKNTYICYLTYGREYCMQGGDNGESFSSNSQVIREFNHDNSYCVINNSDDYFGCAGSYGMEMYAYTDGRISAYYVFGVGCDVETDSTSKCW